MNAYLEMAAQHSKGNAQLWFRYLSKCDFGDADAPGGLTMFQRVSLKAALAEDSPTGRYIAALNAPAKMSMVEALRAKYSGEMQ